MASTLEATIQRIARRVEWDVEDVSADEVWITITSRFRDTDHRFTFWLQPVKASIEAFYSGPWFHLGYTDTALTRADLRLMKAIAGGLSRIHPLHGESWFEQLLQKHYLPEEDGPQFLYGGDQFEIRLTMACNEECLFCNSSDGAVNTTPSLKMAIQAMENARKEGARRLAVSGGEPLLVPWVGEALDAARRLGYEIVTLQTNAVLLDNKDTLEAIRPSDPELFISLHGTTPETIGAVTQKPALVSAKMRGIRNALEAGFRTGFNFVVCSLNYREFLPFIEWAAGLEGRSVFVCVSFIAPTGSAWKNREKLIPRMSQVSPFLIKGMERARSLRLTLQIGENCGIPTCVDTRLRDFSEPYSDDRPIDIPPDKTKIPVCDACSWNYRCSGIFRRYLLMYGDSEFGN